MLEKDNKLTIAMYQQTAIFKEHLDQMIPVLIPGVRIIIVFHTRSQAILNHVQYLGQY